MQRFLLLVLVLPLVGYAADINLNFALRRLDDVLKEQQSYLDKRQARIDSLNAEYSSEPSRTLLLQIAEAYKGYNNDSAMVYLRRGAEYANDAGAQNFIWRLASLMPLGGLFDQAIQTYNLVDSQAVSEADLASYYDSGRQMYSYISAFYIDYPETTEKYKRNSLKMQLKLLDVLPLNSREYKFNLGEYSYFTGKNDRALLLLEEFVEQEPETSNLRARAAYHLYTIYKATGDESTSLYYLSLSAISDIMSATRDVASLQELGNEMYASGYLERAYNYLSAALEKAVTCGAPLRMVETAKVLPIIERAYNSRMSTSRRNLYWVVAGLWVLLTVLFLTMLKLNHEMAKMSQLQENLRRANGAKEIYISQFLSLCSIYMDKLNQFCKIVTRKLAAGQSDELYRMAKSGRFIEEQSSEFYEVFDNAFLHMYPDFVVQVNKLLRPECQIILSDGETLNTDLRILAFLRLGIEESQRIAQVLNYSLNTVYAYRNRLRGRAIDRETFEADVMRISSQV